ncbi:hypothetical protein BKA82DRAFT_28352 [Pisolithus tinctorius]|uniref:Uncharacterized protein n=1 Tax=Pisolithus tinctorius Marx 270 TaxID=870435 RepID=A0A0C3P3J7_PISTI|nr:hypothetical protein BKA82DRAFT_28352 [Pisolithus tinctorius]KIO01844.1 hypothetical protein M404DRAFT_28352 [Pisolithus tinctorius Marx 270]
MALSKAGLTPAIFNLADEAARIVCRSPYNDMCCRIAYLEDDLNDHDDEICHLQDKINELHHTFPAPMLVKQEAWDFEHARVASLGGPDHHILDQPGAGPLTSQMALPTVTFVSGGRVQAKPAGSHILREQPSSQHRWPHHPLTDDGMMIDHAVGFPDIPSDVQMTLDEGAPSVPAQGTMFPEFDGTEWPHCMLSLGKGSDGKNKILFMRINNNLYTYEGEKIDSVKCNLRLHVVLLVLVGKRLYGWAVWFEGGILGPVALFNTADDIHQLYVKDLIAYLNLWKRCKLGSNEVINLALSEWKPPAWSSKKSCERREALKEKGKAAQPQGEEEQAPTVGIPPPTSGPSGGAPALQEQIADAPSGSTPASNVGSTPTPALIDCVVVQLHETQQVSEQRPGLSSQAQSSTRTQPPHKAKGAKPSGGKSRGIPELPSNAPPLDSSVEAWREFIDKEQSHPCWGEDTGREYVNGIIANGGENNPQVMAKIEPLKKALTEPCPPSDVRSREWYECQAQAIGCTINQVPPGHTPLWADNQQIVSAFASAAFIYDLPHCPHGGASTVRGNPPAKDSEPKEGEMTDDLFKDEDRLRM